MPRTHRKRRLLEEITCNLNFLTREQIAEWQNRLRTIEAEPIGRGEIAVLETSLDIMRFGFFTDVAPNHSANFKQLANSGFYRLDYISQGDSGIHDSEW